MHSDAKLGHTALIILVSVAVASVFFDVQPSLDDATRHIGHADQANLANLARNIVEGNGFVVDNLWLLRNGGIPGNELPRPEDYWSIYAAAAIAPFFKLFGATRESLLFAASTIKLTIAVLAVWWTWRFSKSSLGAVACGIILLIHPKMSAVIMGTSDIYLTLMVLSFGISLCLAITRKAKWLLIVSGLLAGVAIGVKPSGGLLLGCLLAYFVLTARNKELIFRSSLLVLGFVVGLAPLIAYNLSNFGEPVSPAIEIVREGAADLWVRRDDPNAFFNPEPGEFSDEERAKIRLQRPLAQMIDFVEKTARGYVVPLWFFPFLYYWGSMVFTGFKRGREYLYSPEGIFSIFVGLMTIGGLVLSTQIHMNPRYWNFLFPLFTILTVVSMARLSRHLLIFAIAWTIGVGAIHYSEKEIVLVPKAYEQLQAIVPEDAIVLTSNPWELAFHARRRAVALPYTDKIRVLKQVAERYGANYLVILNKDARHAAYNGIERGYFPPYIEAVHNAKDLKVGQFRWDQLTPDKLEKQRISDSIKQIEETSSQ